MKKTPPPPEYAKSIARWENEGGAGKPPSQEERDTEVPAENERLPIRACVNRAS